MEKIYLELGHFTLRDATKASIFILLFRKLVESGFATTHLVDFLWDFKTSYHLLIFPLPTNLPNSLPSPCHSTYDAPQQQRVTLERNKIDR